MEDRFKAQSLFIELLAKLNSSSSELNISKEDIKISKGKK
jgi:hypothetical protein